MRRISEKTIEVSFCKRIVAMIMMVSYISVMSPVSLFAESVTNDTEAKRSVSVKEEKSEVLISAEEGGIVTLGDASIEIPAGALKKDTKISRRYRRISLYRNSTFRRLQIPACRN